MKYKLLVGKHSRKEGTLPPLSTSLDELKKIIKEKKVVVQMPGGTTRDSTLVDELMIDVDEIKSKREALTLLDDARPTVVYVAGDIIESEVDLCAKFNQYHPHTGAILSQKFERVESLAPQHLSADQIDAQIEELQARKEYLKQQATLDPETPVVISPTLASMSVRELQRMAAAEEIDLGGATRKEDILKIMSQAHTPAQA